MTSVRVRLLRVVDEHQPGFVLAELVDADGRRHEILDKIPILTSDPAPALPCDGVVRCRILDRHDDRARISLESPDHVETTAGLSELVVPAAALLIEARFCRYALRTTDVAAANAFYDAVLGERGDGIFELHEQARARGAPPHWLGMIETAELGGVERAAARFLAAGATQLGPIIPAQAVLRDPGGAVVGLTDQRGPSKANVVAEILHAANAARAAEIYREVFGWTPRDPVEITGRPELHAHWLFVFGTTRFDQALDEARARGGRVFPAVHDGTRVAMVEDGQGAAFGLKESGRAV
jgi:predicted enzyme related to lactoylglutathione lyase